MHILSVWFKYLKPLSYDKTIAGLPREAIIGQVGTVIAVPVIEHTGKVRFPMPILGDDEWQFSDGPVGSRSMSDDFPSLEAGLRALSPCIIIMED